jgi:hypothetical protein
VNLSDLSHASELHLDALADEIPRSVSALLVHFNLQSRLTSRSKAARVGWEETFVDSS